MWFWQEIQTVSWSLELTESSYLGVTIMAVGYKGLPELSAISGFRLGIASAGIKKPGRRDIVVMELAEGCEVAAVFTRNAFCAAPVTLAKKHLTSGPARYLLVNTGNANAGTGAAGMTAAE